MASGQGGLEAEGLRTSWEVDGVEPCGEVLATEMVPTLAPEMEVVDGLAAGLMILASGCGAARVATVAVAVVTADCSGRASAVAMVDEA